ncbi:hypothetical protein HY091_02185 [Candidatus Kaiserbacteria bacterium]|nr:hypothetical protein [Candidatus Kaiserbacteria bacterium]
MKDVSIEYAHIYTNSKINEEHQLSLEILEEVRQSSESLVVLVDDYSFPDPTFNYDSFTAWLSKRGHSPNVVFRESQLIPLCDQTLELVKDRDLKEELVTYIQTKKYACSLFIAAWYLLRLGKLNHTDFPESESAARLINILPESFRPFEEKAFGILKATEYAKIVDNIENRYIKGRAIA